MSNRLSWDTGFLLLMSHERRYLNLVSLISRANNRVLAPLAVLTDADVIIHSFESDVPNTHP